MKRLLQSTSSLVVILALITAAMWLIWSVSGQQGPTAKATPSSQEPVQWTIIPPEATPVAQVVITGTLGVSERSVPDPKPSATLQLDFEALAVEGVEEVTTGPYYNIFWSPNGKLALVSKDYTDYRLARSKRGSTQGFPSSVIPGFYTGLSNLWVFDSMTGVERQLAEQVGSYAYGWSPDSSQAAYLAPTESEGIAGGLYILDVATGQIQQLVQADFLGIDYRPQWLPTDEIVYVRDGQLWAIQADGTGERALSGFKFHSRIAVEAGKDAYLGQSETPIGFRFSPTGQRIAYLTLNRNERAIADHLWLANADGSQAKLITIQAEGSYYEWSSDGEWLLFNTLRDIDDVTVDERDPGLRGLGIVKADGAEAYNLYRAANWHKIVSPIWSPDNAMIAFIEFKKVEKPDSPHGIFREGVIRVIKADGSRTAVLSGLPDHEAPLRVWWSPDGKHLFTFRNSATPEQYRSDRLTLVTE